MALVVTAVGAFHWFGHAYAAGDPVDTAGYDANALRRLLAKAPVMVADSTGPAVADDADGHTYRLGTHNGVLTVTRLS